MWQNVLQNSSKHDMSTSGAQDVICLCVFVPTALNSILFFFFFLHISVPVRSMVVCQHWHLLNWLLDSQTMASLCVLSYTVIIWCLSLCVFVFLCTCECVCSPFNKKVPLCYKSTPSSVMLQGRRQDRANQRWYVHTQQEEEEEESTQNYIHQQKEIRANTSWCHYCHVHVKG